MSLILIKCASTILFTSFLRYKFSWQLSKDKWPRRSGVKQGDEVQFIFGEPLNHPEDYLIEEKELSKLMMTYWTNFAKSG